MRKILVLALFMAMALPLKSWAGAAGATTAVQCAATSTQLLTAADLGTTKPRSFLLVCNNGPGVGYVAFGTSNAATVSNGLPLQPMQCLPAMAPVMNGYGVAVPPSNLDIACISDNANSALANMTALDY